METPTDPKCQNALREREGATLFRRKPVGGSGVEAGGEEGPPPREPESFLFFPLADLGGRCSTMTGGNHIALQGRYEVF